MVKVKNKHGFHKKTWKTLTPEAQEVFNDLYEEIRAMGPDLFLHPKTLGAHKMSKGEFKTIAWNAAFLAALRVNDFG